MKRSHRPACAEASAGRLHRLAQILGILIIVSTFSASPRLLNLYDEEIEIVVVQPQTRLTDGQVTQIRNPYQTEYEKMLYPTVRITTPSGTGSGVIISHRKDAKDADPPDGRAGNTIYILTACHVVDNQNVVDIELYDSTVITASVVITDTSKDLALLRALSDPACHMAGRSAVNKATLAPRDYTPYIFTPVWAVGCSLGLPPRPSYGHLCAGVYPVFSGTVNNWEIPAPILPGNSGGPVYDAHTFEVIGIAVWVKTYQWQLVTTMAGIVPINQIYKFLLTAETQSTQSKTK